MWFRIFCLLPFGWQSRLQHAVHPPAGSVLDVDMFQTKLTYPENGDPNSVES